MTQVTLRLSAELAERLKTAARARDRSVNAWAAAVLSAAVDPDLAGDEATITRERLARAGLLSPPGERRGRRPRREQTASARAAAGSGTRLGDLISEGRR
jgi:predicted transcriptional regulator